MRYAITFLSLCLAACSPSPHRGGNEAAQLTLIDSFHITPTIKENTTGEDLLRQIGSVTLQDDTAAWLAFISPDSAITIRRIDEPGPDRKVRLDKITEMPSVTPTAIAFDSGWFYLYFEEQGVLVQLSEAGRFQTKYKIEVPPDQQWTASGTLHLDVNRENAYLRVFESRPPNQLASYCDVVLKLSQPKAAGRATSGKYPAAYLRRWVVLRNAHRVILSTGEIIYGFSGSDSLYKYDKQHRLIKSAKLVTSAGNYRVPDEAMIGNLKYLNQYYNTSEQNILFKYIADSLIVVVKKLASDSVGAFNTILIGIDADLHTKYEIPLRNIRLSRDILFLKGGLLYVGNSVTGVVKRYKLSNES